MSFPIAKPLISLMNLVSFRICKVNKILIISFFLSKFKNFLGFKVLRGSKSFRVLARLTDFDNWRCCFNVNFVNLRGLIFL